MRELGKVAVGLQEEKNGKEKIWVGISIDRMDKMRGGEEKMETMGGWGQLATVV